MKLRYKINDYVYKNGMVYKIWLGFINIPLFTVDDWEDGVRAVNRLANCKYLLTSKELDYLEN